jgi:TrpR-related protein YerC/YecD
MLNQHKEKDTALLFKTLAQLKNEEEFRMFFEDLCTYKEIEQMSQRLESACLLNDGKTYSHIIEKIEISSATLSRISRCIQYGSGGYSKIFVDIINNEKNASEDN